MVSVTREHMRYLKGLHDAAVADAATCAALEALADEDVAWLKSMGWERPPHAEYLRLNGLRVADLPLPESKFRRRHSY